jgi:hypothetical protein
VALGVGGFDLNQCALWLLREALETKQRISGPKDVDELPNVGLLPLVLRCSGHNLLTLCVNNQKLVQTDSHIATAEGTGHINIERAGFSMDRWLLWRQRLQELSQC